MTFSIGPSNISFSSLSLSYFHWNQRIPKKVKIRVFPSNLYKLEISDLLPDPSGELLIECKRISNSRKEWIRFSSLTDRRLSRSTNRCRRGISWNRGRTRGSYRHHRERSLSYRAIGRPTSPPSMSLTVTIPFTISMASPNACTRSVPFFLFTLLHLSIYVTVLSLGRPTWCNNCNGRTGSFPFLRVAQTATAKTQLGFYRFRVRFSKPVLLDPNPVQVGKWVRIGL